MPKAARAALLAVLALLLAACGEVLQGAPAPPPRPPGRGPAPPGSGGLCPQQPPRLPRGGDALEPVAPGAARGGRRGAPGGRARLVARPARRGGRLRESARVAPALGGRDDRRGGATNARAGRRPLRAARLAGQREGGAVGPPAPERRDRPAVGVGDRELPGQPP